MLDSQNCLLKNDNCDLLPTHSLMTRYPKLRVIAIYVLKRIAAATTHLANKLTEDYEREARKRRQVESVQEAVGARLNTRPSSVEDDIDPSTENTPTHDGEEVFDAMEISPPRTQSVVHAADEHVYHTHNENELRNRQKMDHSTIPTKPVQYESKDNVEPVLMTRRIESLGTEAVQDNETQTDWERKIKSSCEKGQCYSTISRPKKRGTVLRFNDLSRQRTFEEGLELQGNYAEALVSTFEGNGITQAKRLRARSLQMSQTSNETSKLPNAELKLKSKHSKSNHPEQKSKLIRFNDLSRMIMFEKGEIIQRHVEEQLVPTFPPMCTHRKRKRYNPLEVEYPSDVFRPRKKRKIT